MGRVVRKDTAFAMKLLQSCATPLKYSEKQYAANLCNVQQHVTFNSLYPKHSYSDVDPTRQFNIGSGMENWFIAQWQQAITMTIWTNIYFSSRMSCCTHLTAISQKMLMTSISQTINNQVLTQDNQSLRCVHVIYKFII